MKEGVGSSETKREVSFNFEEYTKIKVSHKKKIKEKELQWLIGFMEGDGSWIVSNKRNFFIINQKEVQVLYKIREILGFGKISKYREYYRYIVANEEGTERLIKLCNGNLVMEKCKERFKKWLENYNEKRREEEKIKYREEKKDWENTKWISGLIDAEGCFYAIKRKDRKKSIRISLIIDQKGEKEVLEKIAEKFKGYIVKRKEVEGMNRVILSSKESQKRIINYLQREPLKSQKVIDYKRWKRLSEGKLEKVKEKKLERLYRELKKNKR